MTSHTKEKSLSNESTNNKTPAVATHVQKEHINILKGRGMKVGNGKVRSWIKIKHDALKNLPDAN